LENVTKNKKNVKQGTVAGQISLKGQKYYIKQGNNLIIKIKQQPPINISDQLAKNIFVIHQ